MAPCPVVWLIWRNESKSLQMICYHCSKQLRFEFFRSPFSSQLNSSNRWVQLAQSLPWDGLCLIYHRSRQDQGARSKPARQVIGALIIKQMFLSGEQESTWKHTQTSTKGRNDIIVGSLIKTKVIICSHSRSVWRLKRILSLFSLL